MSREMCFKVFLQFVSLFLLHFPLLITAVLMISQPVILKPIQFFCWWEMIIWEHLEALGGIWQKPASKKLRNSVMMPVLKFQSTNYFS